MRERSGQPSFFSSLEAIKRDLRDEGVSSVDAWREASDQPETRSRISRAYWQTACNKALEEFDLELFFKLESIQPEIVVDPDVIQASLFALLDSITSKQSSKIHEQIKSFVLIAQSHQIRVETVWFQQAIEKAFLQIMTAGDIEALSRLNAFVTSYPIKLSEETLQGVRRQLIETSQGTQTGSGSLNVSVLFPLLQRLGVSQTELGEWKLDWSMRDASMAQKLYENELLSRKQVQALYRFRFQQRGFLAFESDCFALAPDAELVQEAYQQLFDSSFQTSDFFEHFALLRRNTKTAPDLTRFEGRLKSVVMAYLREQMSTSLQGQKGRLSHAVQYLDRGLGISVSVSQTDVNEWYEWAIQEQNPRIFLEIAEVFTLRPTLDSKMLRQFFLSCLVNESPKTLSELSVLLGLPPGLTAEERDRAYHDALEQRQGQALMLVHRMAGGAPETQALFQYIDDLLVQGDVEQARACIETFHLPIDEERSTTIARQMLRAGDLEAWFEWSKRYGQPEVSGSDAEVGLSRYADRIAVESFKGVEDEERLVECVKRVLRAAKLVLNEEGAHVIYAALITRRARVSQTSQSQLEHLSEIMNRDVGLSPSVHSEPNSFLNVLRRNPDIATQMLSHTVRAGDYVGLLRLMQMMRPGELVSRVELLLDVIVADIAQFLGKSDQPNKQLAIKSVLSFFCVAERGGTRCSAFASPGVYKNHLGTSCA